MDNKRRFYENDTRELIKSITGFQEDEENFHLCLDFALSNFTNTNLPDIDWFKVKRRIFGLCEKYHSNSELEKAKNLRYLATKLLEKLSSGNISEKSRCFSALSLLCSLSGSVEDCASTEKSQKERDVVDGKEADGTDEIDWVEYLHEDDIEAKDLSDEDSETWSDLEDSDPESSLLLQCSLAPPNIDSGIGATPDSAVSPYPPLEPFRPYEEPTLPKKAIRLQKPYWDPRYQSTKLQTRTNDFHANFTQFWEEYLAERCPIYTPETNIVLTEKNVLREILWMLHGVKKTFLFIWVNEEFQVRKHVHLTHLTEGTLHKILSSLCHYGNKMAYLIDFVCGAFANGKSTSRRCQTFKAYAKGLHYYLLQYSQELTSYEKIIIDQNETMTVIQLTLKLKPHFDFLELMYCTHCRAVSKISKDSSPFFFATLLLDSLWKQLTECSLWMTKKSNLQFILMMFLTSFHPYINMLEAAIVRGQLTDTCSEFLIEWNKEIAVTAENFWIDGFKLRKLPNSAHDYFLELLFEDILLASKSMKMLQTLDCFYEAESGVQYVYDYLFLDIVENFHSLYQRQNYGTFIDGDDETPVKENTNLSSSMSNGTEDQKYSHQFEMLNAAKENCIDVEKHGHLCQRILELIQPASFLLLDDILKHSLLPCIQSTCRSSKKALIQALKEKYHLMSHIAVMKRYFLMECGDIMFSFYTEVFKKIFTGEEWRDNTFIYSIFKDAVSIADPKACERLLLYLNEDEQVNTKEILSELGLLSLTYDVGWPINVILNQEIQNRYCKIFCFLMQVKCAKYSLDDLYCIHLKASSKPVVNVPKWLWKSTDMPQTQMIHGMHILRMKLLHFVNGFHNYIMTCILQSCGLELNEKLEEAESLEDVLSSLHDYVSGLEEHCLLNSKHPHLQQRIQILLNLAIKFQTLWRSGIENVSVEDVKQIEEEYNSSLAFVLLYLDRPWKRGQNLHFEALASTIFTRSHLQRIFS